MFCNLITVLLDELLRLYRQLHRNHSTSVIQAFPSPSFNFYEPFTSLLSILLFLPPSPSLSLSLSLFFFSFYTVLELVFQWYCIIRLVNGHGMFWKQFLFDILFHDDGNSLYRADGNGYRDTSFQLEKKNFSTDLTITTLLPWRSNRVIESFILDNWIPFVAIENISRSNISHTHTHLRNSGYRVQ